MKLSMVRMAIRFRLRVIRVRDVMLFSPACLMTLLQVACQPKARSPKTRLRRRQRGPATDNTSRRLVGIGLNAPVILHEDLRQGFLLLSDLGDTTYLSVLKESNADKLYHSAIDALIVLQSRFENAAALPPYGQALLRREMMLFSDWYIERHLNTTLMPPLRGDREGLS